MVKKMVIAWLLHGKGLAYLLILGGLAIARVKTWWLWRQIERECQANREAR